MSACGLTPGSVVHAAAADLQRFFRNCDARLKRRGGPYEQYAFHRAHVRRAKDAHELIKLAFDNPMLGAGSGKRWTRNLYTDLALLAQALAVAQARAAA